jgi:stalled ribosome alternative rescue factor ArfA
MLTDEEIIDIHEQIHMSMDCFIHCETKEVIILIPDPSAVYDVDDEDEDNITVDEDFIDDYNNRKRVEANPNDFCRILKMDSHEGYAMMENFTETVTDKKFREKLERALNGKGPFRRFKDTLNEEDEYKKKWYEFEAECQFKFVKNQILELYGINPYANDDDDDDDDDDDNDN